MSDAIRMRPHLKWAERDVPEGEWLLCRIAGRSNWWDLDDELEAIPGRRAMPMRGGRRWHLVPAVQLSALTAIAERNPNRVVAHPA